MGLIERDYLNHLIQLWPGDRVKQMEKINKGVVMKNCLTVVAGGKRIVFPFRSQEFCKFIGFVIYTVIYVNKGHKLWI